MKVRPEQVQYILDIVRKHTLLAPALLDAVNAMCKVEEYNLPLQRNQQLTMKTLMLHKVLLMIK